eukprot:scaffold19853_cov56-Phaeocystis_antarctica.AAC.6
MAADNAPPQVTAAGLLHRDGSPLRPPPCPPPAAALDEAAAEAAATAAVGVAAAAASWVAPSSRAVGGACLPRGATVPVCPSAHGGPTDCLPPLPLRSALQRGQVGRPCLVWARTASHPLKHAKWNSWPHGSCSTRSPAPISLRQIAHSSTSRRQIAHSATPDESAPATTKSDQRTSAPAAATAPAPATAAPAAISAVVVPTAQAPPSPCAPPPTPAGTMRVGIVWLGGSQASGASTSDLRVGPPASCAAWLLQLRMMSASISALITMMVGRVNQCHISDFCVRSHSRLQPGGTLIQQLTTAGSLFTGQSSL